MNQKRIDRVQQKQIELSKQDTEKVFSLLEKPPIPNERLKAAVAKHQEFFLQLNNSSDLKR
jgi:uncharacterized protein (DUF1778 family)